MPAAVAATRDASDGHMRLFRFVKWLEVLVGMARAPRVSRHEARG
jgi:hypothetical protein